MRFIKLLKISNENHLRKIGDFKQLYNTLCNEWENMFLNVERFVRSGHISVG